MADTEDTTLQKELSKLADERTTALSKLSRREIDKKQEICDQFHVKRESIMNKHSEKNDLANDRKEANKEAEMKGAERSADAKAKLKQTKKKKSVKK